MRHRNLPIIQGEYPKGLEAEVEETTVASDNPARFTMGAVVASAVVAALVAFFLRRAMRAQDTEVEISQAAIRERAAAAGGEFVRSYLAPEMKPMMITVLKDIREYVDRGFQRAEQALKDF